MKFISNRDYVLRSIHGHAIEFKKGVPTQVPRSMHNECLEKGILPEDDGLTQVTEAMDPTAPKLAPEDALDRNDQILKVIESVVKKNNAADFTGGGHPNASVVTASLGWKADQKEVSAVWTKNRGALLRGEPKE